MNFDSLTDMRHIPPVYVTAEEDILLSSWLKIQCYILLKGSHPPVMQSSTYMSVLYAVRTVSTARMNVIHSCRGPSGNPIIATHKNNPILRFLNFCNGHPLPTQ